MRLPPGTARAYNDVVHLSPESSRAVLNLARRAIRAMLLPQSDPGTPASDDPALSQRAGCFVSLHDARSRRLRGCVGRLDAEDPLSVVVPRMAEACLRDPRFERLRVMAGDLASLEIEVTLLSPLRDCRDAEDFDLLDDGIVLQVGGQTGCFLPQVARETGWTREQLLSRLAEEKLDLPPDAWRRADARLRKFSTLVIGPEPF